MPETTPLIKAALNLRGGAGFDVYCESIIKAVRNWQKIENLPVSGLLFMCILYLELCQISL